jgi:hypothetical protein
MGRNVEIACFSDVFQSSSLAADSYDSYYAGPHLVTHHTLKKAAPSINYVDPLLRPFSFIFLFAESPVSASQRLKLYVGRLCTFTTGSHGHCMVRFSVRMARLVICCSRRTLIISVDFSQLCL